MVEGERRKERVGKMEGTTLGYSCLYKSQRVVKWGGRCSGRRVVQQGRGMREGRGRPWVGRGVQQNN